MARLLPLLLLLLLEVRPHTRTSNQVVSTKMPKQLSDHATYRPLLTAGVEGHLVPPKVKSFILTFSFSTCMAPLGMPSRVIHRRPKWMASASCHCWSTSCGGGW